MLKGKFFTLFGRGRGAALAAILIVFAFTACVDPTSSGGSGGTLYGSAARTPIDDFMLTGFYNLIEAAGAESIACTPSGDSLSITFSGDSSGVVEEAVKDYFSVWTPEVSEAAADRIYEYGQGNIYVIFRTGTSPFEMDVYKSPPVTGDIPGWPSRALLEGYGLHNIPEINPDAVNQLYYNTSGDTLTITFVDSDGSNGLRLQNYFDHNHHWLQETAGAESEPGTLAYHRGIAYVSFKPSLGANDDCTVDVQRETLGSGGWPQKDTTDSYGLLGLVRSTVGEVSLPVHSTTNSETNTPGAALVIGFYGTDDTPRLIENYFSPANNWASSLDQANPLATIYTRGITTVTFDTSQSPYYTLDADVQRIEDIIADWPDAMPAAAWPEGTTLLQQYSLQGFTMPPGVVLVPYAYPTNNLPSPLVYVTGTKKTGTGTTEDPERVLDVITLHFYGTAATEAAIKDYFSNNNNWTGGVDNSASTTQQYSRGLGYAVFETSGRPYYTLEVDVEPVTGHPGWPLPELLKKYGLFGMTDRPEGVLDTALSYTEGDSEDSQRNLLKIDFYGKSATETYISGYLENTLNNWTRVGDDTGIRYERGLSTVRFDFSQAPRYSLEIDLDNPGGTEGWPTREDLVYYGLPEMAPADWPDTELSSYRKGYKDDAASTDLVMRFYGTTATKTAVKDYFSGNGWTEAESGSGGSIEYSRGNSSAIFNPTQSPYFELTFSVDRPQGTPGWPAEILIRKYGLHGITAPSGVADMTYSELAVGANTSLTITIMDGNDAVAAHFNSYFSAANHWIVPESDSGTVPEEGVSSYYRGLSYVNLDISGKTTIVLDISVEKPGTPGWPEAGQLSRYLLGGLDLSALTDIEPISYSESEVESTNTTGTTTRINQLTIRFYGTAATEAAVRAYFAANSAIWTYSELNTYSRGALNAILETGGSPYYELVIDRDIFQSGIPGWPGTALLNDYGLMDMNPALWNTWGVTEQNAYYTEAVPEGGTAKVLTLKFYGTNATGTAINSYFTAMNKWAEPEEESNTAIYVRGLTTVSINDEYSDVNYFELTASVKQIDGAIKGWPDLAKLEEYGLHGFSALAPSGSIPVNYTTGVTPAEDENTAERQNLTIRFYGTASTQTYIEGYFSAVNNKWTLVTETEPDPESTTVRYTRGLAEVTVEKASMPYYYEISSNMEYIVGEDPVTVPWFTPEDREAFGLYGGELAVAPTGVSHLSHSVSADTLSIRFYGTTDIAAINYFSNSTGTGWTLDSVSSDASNTRNYSRGISTVSISAEERPFYEITVSRLGTRTSDLPEGVVLSDYGIDGIGDFLTTQGAGNLAWEPPAEDREFLVLRFYGTETLNEDALHTWIVGDGGWTPSTVSETATREYIRSNEGYMILDTKAKPYYELHIYKGLVLVQGWPTERMAEFGLTGSTSLNDYLVGVAPGYIHLADENRLILDFPFDSSGAVETWFTGSGTERYNRWAASDTPAAYSNETATHTLSATLTGYQNEGRCKLVIEKESFAGARSGWPTTGSIDIIDLDLLLNKYKFKILGAQSILTQPDGVSDVSWVEEVSDTGTKSLVIRFTGSLAGNETVTTSMNNIIKAAGNGEALDADYEEGWIAAETGSSASEVYTYSYYPEGAGGIASTLYMEFEPYSAVKPYFKITIAPDTGSGGN